LGKQDLFLLFFSINQWFEAMIRIC
jgi:hypothetical protein